MLNLFKAGLCSLVVAGSILVATPAQAVTQHCDMGMFPNKVEVSGDSSSVYTGLPAGTMVCLKVATQITHVYVDDDGYVTNTEILNQNGMEQAISYFAWAEGYGS